MGFAVKSPQGKFEKHHFTRHPVGEKDILIDILYTGICHSDLHQAHNDWGFSSYPMVLGHEIVGKAVKKFKVGDYAGVGCMINSCGECNTCKAGREQFCERRQTVYTYASKDHFHNDETTMGGYANNIVVSERFAVTIPKNADIQRVAPLLCAGITTYSPIEFSHIRAGMKAGVAGFGGLGHMAVQYLKAKGADITVFDITEEKRKDAYALGASRYVNIRHQEDMKGIAGSLDFIIVAIGTQYDPQFYLSTLKEGGEMAVVGQPALNQDSPSLNLVTLPFSARRKVYGSLIGGMEETQQMINYSVSHNIYPIVEVIPADAKAIDKAFEQVHKGEVKFRYVIDFTSFEKKTNK